MTAVAELERAGGANLWVRINKEFSIAFDDGPSDTAGDILDILTRYTERAVFFVNGKNVAGREEILRRIVGDGHEIGNHGWSHRALVDDAITLPEVLAEIRSTHDAVVAAAGVAPTKFRTPFVRWSPDVHTIARALGYERVYVDPSIGDYGLAAAEIVEAARHVRGTLWLHEGVAATVAALDQVLEERASR